MLRVNQLIGFGSDGEADVTPDAIAFANISGNDDVETSVENVTGINQAITLRGTISGLGGSGTGAISIKKNGSVQSTDASIANGDYVEASYVSGDTISFLLSNTGTTGQTKTGTVTVTNRTDVGTPTLDTFTFSVTVS